MYKHRDLEFTYKTLECTDASKIEYTNIIECNFWVDNCIYNSVLGGCRIRSISHLFPK